MKTNKKYITLLLLMMMGIVKLSFPNVFIVFYATYQGKTGHTGIAIDRYDITIRDLVEKPRAEEAPSDLAIIGRYVLTPDIFSELESISADRTGEIQLTNGLRQLRSIAQP